MSGGESSLLSAHLASSDIVAINVLICSCLSQDDPCVMKIMPTQTNVRKLINCAHLLIMSWSFGHSNACNENHVRFKQTLGSWSCLLISRPLASSSFHQLPVNGLILFAVSASQKLICARALTSSSMFHTVSHTTCIVHMLHCIRGASILDYAVHCTNINIIWYIHFTTVPTPFIIIHTSTIKYITMKRSHPQVWYIKVQYILKLNT